MILYYALGGGLGHLTRGRRVLETLGLVEASLVTASAHASDPRVTGGFPVIRVPTNLERDVEAHRSWLRGLPCDRLIVDTFPCGIQGELSGLDVPMDLVARRLRWDEYRRAVPAPLPRFETVWCVEELEPEQATAVSERCDIWSAMALDTAFGPPASRRLTRGRLARAPARQPPRPRRFAGLDFWLIVHSGPEEEVRELVAYAEELRRVAATQPDRVLVATRSAFALPPGFEAIDAYPVEHLFPAATRIISAAGFNVMLETEPWRDKHDVVPFARTFDDQFWRAARRRGVLSPRMRDTRSSP